MGRHLAGCLPLTPAETPPDHPLALSAADLGAWLAERQLRPDGASIAHAYLTLPGRQQAPRGRRRTAPSRAAAGSSVPPPWSGLPLQAGEPIPKQTLWWSWRVEGLALEPAVAAAWLSTLPLSGDHPDLADELRWWSHLQRWALSLIARGRLLPQVEDRQARWVPLLNREGDRRRLEEMAARMPQVATCAMAGAAQSCRRPGSGRLRVASLLEALLDGRLRHEFTPSLAGLDPLLAAWQRALGKGDGRLALHEEDSQRLVIATHHWREGVAGRVAPARTCLELFTPAADEDLWELRFSLQAEADPSLRLPAGMVWAAGDSPLQLGEVEVSQPGELLLEGLGRALQVFEPIERGLDLAAPESMALAPAEAFVLVRTAAAQLRDVGVGVVLPPSLSGGLASRLGLAIEAEIPTSSRGFSLGENLTWKWELMIGGVTLSLKDLERLSAKRSPLVQHKGAWIELRPSDLRNAERFCAADPSLSLDLALRLTATEGDTLMRLPVHRFTAGPRLQAVLEQYHQQKAPDPLPAPEGFCGQLRPYQERGLGWLAFLHRFDQGACLADDMGLGKTIQLLAFLQHLKAERELKRPVLLVAPTSVLTNWKREAEALHTGVGGAGALRPPAPLHGRGPGQSSRWRGSGPHQLWPAAAGQRIAGDRRLAGHGDRRSPGHQEPLRQAIPGRPRPGPARQGEPFSHRPHRHSRWRTGSASSGR